MRQSCRPCLSRGLLAGDQVIMIWRICSIYQQTASNCSLLCMHLSLQHTRTSHETTGRWNVWDWSCDYSVIFCRASLDPGSPVTANCHTPSHPLADQAPPPVAPTTPRCNWSPSRAMQAATMQKQQTQAEEHEKELKVSTGPQNAPNPTLIELHGMCLIMVHGEFGWGGFTTRTLYCGHDQCHSLHLKVVFILKVDLLNIYTKTNILQPRFYDFAQQPTSCIWFLEWPDSFVKLEQLTDLIYFCDQT